ncbi:MAG: phosphodiesterase [Butyricicoccus sp.]|nr:phosphodiesterase [Butyricicoccus sp.]
MKLMIASDIHGSARFTRELLAAFDREQADRLLLLGDILYHGPRNALPEEYAPQEAADMLNARRERILCVRGNCDTEVDQMVLDFPIMAEYCVLWLGARMIFATHGHHFDKDNLPPLSPRDILLHGHTHVPAWERCGNDNLYLNPGSVSIPKDGSERGYMLLDSGELRWMTLSGEVYHREALD